MRYDFSRFIFVLARLSISLAFKLAQFGVSAYPFDFKIVVFSRLYIYSQVFRRDYISVHRLFILIMDIMAFRYIEYFPIFRESRISGYCFKTRIRSFYVFRVITSLLVFLLGTLMLIR